VISQMPKGVSRSGEWVFKRKALLLVAISLLLFFLFDGWSLRMTLKHIHYIYTGVPEGMDLDPNQNFVDPYMALIKRPGSEWERMRTYMIPLIARSSLL
jgi:hypothetical protein